MIAAISTPALAWQMLAALVALFLLLCGLIGVLVKMLMDAKERQGELGQRAGSAEAANQMGDEANAALTRPVGRGPSALLARMRARRRRRELLHEVREDREAGGTPGDEPGG